MFRQQRGGVITQPGESKSDAIARIRANSDFGDWLERQYEPAGKATVLGYSDDKIEGYMDMWQAADVVKQGSEYQKTSPISGRAGYKTVDTPLIRCTTKAECDRYDKDEIIMELERRGFKKAPGRSKFMVKAISSLDEDEEKQAEQRVSAETGQYEYVQYDQKGDARPGGGYVKISADFNEYTTQPELVKMLLAHNKHELARKRMMLKHSTRQGERSIQGAFPSETTNPAMYNHLTGLLNEKHLTQDHHGLVAYDFKGDKHRVEYYPKLNGFGGFAKWVSIGKSTPGATARMLHGNFELDKRGLPKTSQLNYWQHRGLLFKDKDDEYWQVGCKNRKNKKSKNHGTANCTVNKKTGEVQIAWVKYDPDNEFVDDAGGVKGKRFVTPMGVYTYDQLMKLNLDDILKMMIVLELMEEGPKYAGKMKEMGIGPYDEQKYPTGSHIAGRQYRPTKGKKKTTTMLKPQDQQLEEALYRQAGLENCEYPRPPFRCYSDSFIPGTCVPNEEICFKGKYRKKWEATGNFGANPKLGWAKEASKDATEEITQKDIDEYYRELGEYQAGEKNWREKLIKDRATQEKALQARGWDTTKASRDDVSRDAKGPAAESARERALQSIRMRQN